MTVNNNLNSMLASELQISDLASKMTHCCGPAISRSNSRFD